MAVYLALVAGYVDGYALRVLNNYVSFMSGNTTFAGVKAGQGLFVEALPPSLAVAGFLGGSFAGSWVAQSGHAYAKRLLFAVSAGLLAIFIVLNFQGAINANVAIAMLSLAMGMVNPAASRTAGEPLNPTFVTGTLNKIGGHLASAARGERPKDAANAGDTHLFRALVHGCVWAGFLAGAVLSVLAMSWFGRLALVPACAALLAASFVGVDDGRTAPEILRG